LLRLSQKSTNTLKARGFALPAIGNPEDVYIVLRVFGLRHETKRADFVVYVDPWQMFLDERLEFRAMDKWMVTPGVAL